MKKLLCFLSAVFFSNYQFAQVNLVPNPSFEDTLRCPTSINQSLTTVSWSSYGGSPDYFNACSPPPPYSVGVPKNIFGYQTPATGNAYCGLITYMSPNLIGGNIREHIGAQLITPLVKGTKYYVSFKAVMAVGGDFTVNIATNKIGVKFMMQPLAALANGTVFNSAHLISNSIISDSTNWTLISGSFVADTNYKYIACGNFFNDANTSTQNIFSPPKQAYYFVDDFMVSTDSLKDPKSGLIEAMSDNMIVPYPNPASGSLSIRMPADGILPEVSLLNLMGQIILQKTFTKNSDAIDLNGVVYGVYYLRIVSGQRIYYEKIVVKE